MKKQYKKPIIKSMVFDLENTILTSGGMNPAASDVQDKLTGAGVNLDNIITANFSDWGASIQ